MPRLMRELPECPFYRSAAAISVHCEGLEEDNLLQLQFLNREGRRRHMHHYCCSMNFKQCPLAKMLYEKYGETP